MLALSLYNRIKINNLHNINIINKKGVSPMQERIAIANQKGGVAKTTTTHALAAGLSEKGFKVLAVDLDPQGNLSSACGAECFNVPTVYELLKGTAKPKEALQHINSYDIIPSNIMLAGSEQELTQTGKEHRLKESLVSIARKYDYILVDTPPSLGILTVNAFTFANKILIPTTAGIFATAGIKQLSDTVKNVQKYCNPDIQIMGILFTRYNPRTNISKEIKELAGQIGKYISAPVYKTFIRSAVAVEESQAQKEDIFSYAGKSTVAEDYRAFIEEMLKGGMQ